MVNNLEISNFERYNGHTEEIRYYIPSYADIDIYLMNVLKLHMKILRENKLR